MHLSSLDLFTKYCFALDLTNYSGMTAWYLSEMTQLRGTNVWNEFMSGNWIVNKNNIPFCSLGADEALKHKIGQ